MRSTAWLVLLAACIAAPGNDPVRVPFTEDTATAGPPPTGSIGHPDGLACGTFSPYAATMTVVNQTAGDVAVNEISEECSELTVATVPSLVQQTVSTHPGASFAFRDANGALLTAWVVGGNDTVVVQ